MKSTADINSQQKKAITQLEYGIVKVENNIGTYNSVLRRLKTEQTAHFPAQFYTTKQRENPFSLTKVNS